MDCVDPVCVCVYVEDTEEARKFNCVQRGHQQALETYTQFIATSLVGGIRNPITTAFFGVIWCVARLKWAEGEY